ncbi:MAG: hypothetical protein ACP5GY_05585 [Vulcanisaeta sp.]
MGSVPDVRVLEGVYQLIHYEDEDEEALIRDFSMRYGDDYMNIYSRAKELLNSLGENADSEVRRYYELLADHAVGKIRGFGDAAYALARYMGLGGDEAVLKVQFRLMGFGEDVVDELIRAGVLMHRYRGVLFVPEYLVPRLLEMSGYVTAPDVRNILGGLSDAELAVVESVAFGSKPIDWLFRAIYGVGFRELVSGIRINGFLDGSTGELVLNPVIDIQELRAILHEIKDFSARSIKRLIGPHGQYTYSKLVRCGVVYTVFGEGGRELILLCPWVLPSRRLLDYHSREDRVFIIMRRHGEEFVEIVSKHAGELPVRTGFVFIRDNEAFVYKPRAFSRSFDSFLDFLYRSNIKVNYLD